MDVSCDHGLIDGMSGTRAKKAEPPIASSSTLLVGKRMWKRVMETQKDETSLERQHCHWIKPPKALTNNSSCPPSLHENRWSWPLFRLLSFRAVFEGAAAMASVLPWLTRLSMMTFRHPQSQNTCPVLITPGCRCSQELRSPCDGVIRTSELKALDPGLWCHPMVSQMEIAW